MTKTMVPDRPPHQWDALREFGTVHANNHESIYRSYQVLTHVVAMLQRGDSSETILELIRWADGGYA